MGRIADSHDELYHYTTAAGLSGILESRSLWATHTSFMNDEEEILGFYDRVLPRILHPVFGKLIESIKDEPEFQKQRGNKPLELYRDEQFEELIRGLRSVAPRFYDHYYYVIYGNNRPMGTRPWLTEPVERIRAGRRICPCFRHESTGQNSQRRDIPLPRRNLFLGRR